MRSAIVCLFIQNYTHKISLMGLPSIVILSKIVILIIVRTCSTPPPPPHYHLEFSNKETRSNEFINLVVFSLSIMQHLYNVHQMCFILWLITSALKKPI